MVYKNLQDVVFALLGYGLASHPSGKGMFILCHFMLELRNFVSDFTGTQRKEIASHLRKDFGLLKRVNTVKDYGDF